MGTITCDKCEIEYMPSWGHRCDTPEDYNSEDEFQATAISSSATEVFDENSEFCIW